MTNKKTKILNWIVLSALIVLLLFTLPYKNIKQRASTFINNIGDFLNNIESIITQPNNTSSDHHIKNITFYSEENNYYAIIEFNSIVASNVSSITINKKEFFKDDFTYTDKSLVVDISSLIKSGDATKINISTILTKNNYTHISTLETAFYKSVNYQIIEEAKKSIVGIRAHDSSFLATSSAWGSGIILKKSTTVKAGLFNDYIMFEYLIITNYHVVENKSSFYVYNKDEDDKYPKSTKLREPNETVELIGYFSKITDLAVLKLTTFDDSLIPLNDPQFTTKEPIEINEDDPVFLIGSPFIGNSISFNSYKIGKIKSTSKTITLIDSDICAFGCESIQTTAFLGEGSSGGGLFDINGNLIGIHFAGNDKYQEAFAIPLYIVVEALDELFAITETKRSLATSFFYFITS